MTIWNTFTTAIKTIESKEEDQEKIQIQIMNQRMRT